MTRIRARLLEHGFVRELLALGVAQLELEGAWRVVGADAGGYWIEAGDSLREDLAEYLKGLADYFRSKAGASPGPKIAPADVNSIRAALGLDKGTTLTDVALRSMEYASDLLLGGKLDLEASLRGLGRKRVMGVGGELVLPAVLKNVEYLEYTSGFLRPSDEARAMLRFDPLWFAILMVGYMTGYAGYYGGTMYMVTSEGVEPLFGTPGLRRLVRGSIEPVAQTNMSYRRRLDSEEVYEMSLAAHLVKDLGEGAREIVWPLKLYKIVPQGKVYVAEKVVMLDLSELVSFALRYFEKLGRLEQLGGKEYAVSIEGNRYSPLEALLYVAERELRKPLGEDNEGLAVILVKDLYRAASTGRRDLLEGAVFRLSRKTVGLVEAGGFYGYVFSVFLREGHLQAVMDAV